MYCKVPTQLLPLFHLNKQTATYMKTLILAIALIFVAKANTHGIGFTHSIFAAHKKVALCQLKAQRDLSLLKKIKNVDTSNLKSKLEKASSTATHTVVGFIVDAIRK